MKNLYSATTFSKTIHMHKNNSRHVMFSIIGYCYNSCFVLSAGASFIDGRMYPIFIFGDVSILRWRETLRCLDFIIPGFWLCDILMG